MCIFLNLVFLVFCSIWGSLHVCIFNVIVLLLAISHVRASFSDPGELYIQSPMMDFFVKIASIQHFINNDLDLFFCDIQNNQGQGKFYQ